MVVKARKIPQKDSSRPIFYKSVTADDLDVDQETRILKAYVAIWNNIDDSCDILRKGCCERSIKARGPESSTNRRIKFLYQHDIRTPLGNPTVLKEDERGLYAEVPIDQIPKGDDVIIQLKSGTLSQFSIGYMYVYDKCQWVEVDDPQDPSQKMYARECKEIELFEFSVVTFGCNEETEFLGLKSNQLVSQRNQLQRDTEETLKSLPYQAEMQLRQLISKHISLSIADPDSAPLGKKDPVPNQKSVDFNLLSNALTN